MYNTIRLKTQIDQKKKALINKVKTKGLYENFGQKELRELQDSYPMFEPEVSKLILEFDEWCMNYEG